MKKEALFHQEESQYCFPLSSKEVVIRLRVAKSDIFDEIKIIYGSKYDFYINQLSALMTKKYDDELFTYYEVILILKDVRLVYVFELINKGKKYYYCEEGIYSKYDYSLAYYNCFQLPYINEIDIPKKIKWLEKAVIYEIFIDRFYQGNLTKKQEYINLKTNDKPLPNSFAGGDLKGITSKLDYLIQLGVNTLYLTPVFKSISNHKYDIIDYYQIDDMFGSEEDFKELINTAHYKGIRIILDAVFNHVSALSKQFKDVINKGKTSKYYNWFIIHGDVIENNNYEFFGVCPYMPKWNTSNKDVRQYLINIGKYYVQKYKIDGWRLDVSDELSHNFWFHFQEQIKEVNKECVLIGENWHDAKSFLRGDQFDSIMNYAFTKALLDFLAYRKLNAKGLVARLNALRMRNNDIINAMMLNLLDSHDTNRFYTEVKKNQDTLLQGLAILFMYDGVPCIYYGIEIPLQGGYDPLNRACFPWDKLDYSSNYFKTLNTLIKLRNNDVISKGSLKLNAKDKLFIIERSLGNNTCKLIINNSKENVLIHTDKLVVSNKYHNNYLEHGGFVIMEVDS